MSEVAFLDLLKETVILILLLSAPVLIVALVVGVGISLLQAVTQIQESTVTFVPKILVSLLTLILASPWMLSIYISHSQQILNRLDMMYR